MASCGPDCPHRTPMLALPVGMGAHCALRTSGDQLFMQTVRVEQLDGCVCVCVCVCVCWVGGHVTHIPLRGCMFKPKALRSRLQNCGLCSQDEDSTQRGPSMNFVD